jgi:hypothetical protein
MDQKLNQASSQQKAGGKQSQKLLSSSETSAKFCRTTQRYIAEDGTYN